jgi:6-phosphogluconate dehydrogenase
MFEKLQRVCDVAKEQKDAHKAERDYFGAHTYELLTAPGAWVHTNWTGRGGNVSSSTYTA